MDFWPKPGALLIGKANNIYAATLDFNTVSRLSPQDVGAYETDGAASNPGWKPIAGFKTTPPPGPPTDTTPPAISGITSTGLTTTGAAISWTTDEPADSQVEYGVAIAYGSQTAADSWLLTAHSQILSGLLPGTLYNYRVKSHDAAGNLGVSNNLTFTTVSITPPPPATDPALIGYWAFNEGAGVGTSDESGHNNNGTLVRSPVWTTGVIGKALQFNATDNGNDNDDPQVLIGRNFNVDAPPFTFTAWINPVDFSDWRAIFSKRDRATVAAMRLDIGLQKTTGRVYVNTFRSYLVFTYVVVPNTWTHIAVVASATGTTLYVNGVPKQTMGIVLLGTSATANTVIGGTGEGIGGDNDPFKGMIDEVRFYSRALSASEVQAINLLR